MKAKKGAAMLCAACLIGTGAVLPAPPAAYAAEETQPVYEGLKYAVTDGAVTITGFTADLPEEVTVPAEIDGLPVTKIAEGAFRYNPTAVSITLPDSVTEIGAESFKSCFKLKTVKLSASITAIPDNAFLESRKLEQLVLPEKLRSIGEKAFAKCLALAELNLPETLETVGEDAFLDTPWIAAKRAENPFLIINHVLVDGNACRGDIIIPEDVKTIGPSAFAYNYYITSVLVPENVTEISRYGFFNCTGLECITVLNPDCVICDMDATISNNYARHQAYYLGSIRGWENSTLQTYTSARNYPFAVIGKVTGDVDLNGTVTAGDAQIVLNTAAERVAYNSVKLRELQEQAADVNGDGMINAADAQLILNYYVQNTVAGIPATWEEIVK